MNRERRKIIAQIVTDLRELAERAAAIQSLIDDVMSDEQGAYEELPESLQSGERGEAMEAAVEALGEAVDGVESLCGEIDTTVEALERAAQ